MRNDENCSTCVHCKSIIDFEKENVKRRCNLKNKQVEMKDTCQLYSRKVFEVDKEHVCNTHCLFAKTF